MHEPENRAFYHSVRRRRIDLGSHSLAVIEMLSVELLWRINTDFNRYSIQHAQIETLSIKIEDEIALPILNGNSVECSLKLWKRIRVQMNGSLNFLN